ncbi:hypothetical protein, partial [uncultured Campylobacter sp.]|uniref:hypothetical protein n=1 Tax=uncultured Campylobacter sp. TaxID=218934 RepID=UPI0026075E47
ELCQSKTSQNFSFKFESAHTIYRAVGKLARRHTSLSAEIWVSCHYGSASGVSQVLPTIKQRRSVFL